MWRFNCSARVFQGMACVEFALGVTHFFDNCTQVEPAATALSAELTQLTHFFSQVGYDLKSNDNGRERLRTHRRCSGRRARLQQHTNGPFDIRNKGRHAKHAVKERLLRPSVARSLGPRLGRLSAALECLACGRCRMKQGAASPSRERRLSTSCAVGGTSSQMSDQERFQFKKRCQYYFSQRGG